MRERETEGVMLSLILHNIFKENAYVLENDSHTIL